MTEALDREGRMGRLAVVTRRRLGEREVIRKGLGSLQSLKGLPSSDREEPCRSNDADDAQ